MGVIAKSNFVFVCSTLLQVYHFLIFRSGILGRTSIGGALKKRPGGGIGSVLGRLGKKPKLSTLVCIKT